MKPLSPKRALFVAEYLKSLDPQAAAVKAGYSERSARVNAYRLLENAAVQAAIAEGQATRAKTLKLEADDVLRELLRIATSDIGEVFDDDGQLRPLSAMSENTRRAIASIEVEEQRDYSADPDEDGEHPFKSRVSKVKFWDKPKGLELLGKHLKLYTEKHEVELGKKTLEQLVLDSYEKPTKKEE